MHILEKYSALLFLFMWSSGAIFVKLGLEDSSVSVFLAIRAIGASATLFFICVLFANKRGLKEKLRVSKPALLHTMLIGALVHTGYQTTYFLALDHNLTPGVLAIILGLQPIITTLLSNEKIGKKGYFYLLLGLAGLTIAISGARDVGAVTMPGLLFGIVSVIAISTGSVMQKKSIIDPVVSAFYQALTASFIFLVLLPFTDIQLNLTPRFLVSATWMIVVVSTLAVLLLYRMLSKSSASKVGVLFYMVPVITMMLDYITFGSKISWITVAGALLVIVAVRNFGKTQPPPPLHPPVTHDKM